MAHVDPVDAARAGNWSLAHGEMTASPWRSGATCARDCMRGRCSVSTNSPPVNSVAGSDNSTATCSGNHELTVDVLVQTVVVARPIAQQ